jgi:hypothetical protein
LRRTRPSGFTIKLFARRADTQSEVRQIMTLQAIPSPGPAPTAPIQQPDRNHVPIRVPVDADFGGGSVLPAEVIGSTAHVLLLQGPKAGTKLARLGAPVRLRVKWDRQMLTGRFASYGVAGRFLVSIGERPIRQTQRYSVDLPGVAYASQLPQGRAQVWVADLSTGGARIRGIDLEVGSELELRFKPPGREEPITVLGFVVRVIDSADGGSVALAFRLVPPSLDVLGTAAPSANQPISAPAE